MSVLPTNPVTNIHSLAIQPSAPRAAAPKVAAPQAVQAPAKDSDGDADTGGVDLRAWPSARAPRHRGSNAF